MKSKHLLTLLLPLLLAAKLPAADDPTAPTPLVTHSEDRLIQMLNPASGEKEKSDACRELAVVGTKAAIPALVPLLADEKFNHMARYALETIPEPGVNEVLRAELSSLRGRPLVGVIGSLGVRRDAKAVKPLTPLLADADADVVQAAARALGFIATPEAVKALQSALPHAALANQAAFGEGLLRSAEAILAAGKNSAAVSIYERLRGRAQIPPRVRAAALRGEIIALGPKGAGLLKTSLVSPEYEIFAVAIRASLDLRNLEATRAITETLPKLTGDQQLVAFKTLGALANDTAVAALLPLTKSGASAVRVAAIEAATATGKPAVVPVMVELLGDADAEVTGAAQDSLAALTVPAAAGAVEALLTSPSAQLRLAGVELAGRRRMLDTNPALLKATGDPAAPVRAAALKRLGELGGAAELPPLLHLIQGMSDAKELELAGDAAGAICIRAGNQAASTAAIIHAAGQAAPAAKATLVGVLGAVGGPEALNAVSLAVNDTHPEVHQAAVRALSEWPDVTAAPALLQVIGAGTGNSERDLAFSGLIKIVRESSAANEEKVKLFAEAGKLARTAADKKLVLAGLGGVSTVDALHVVTPYLADAEVAEDASASAVRICGGLNQSATGEMTPVLQRVLLASKSEPLLEKTRKKLKELGQ